MFSPLLKKEISKTIQELLQALDHDELPQGEIRFILHVDGAKEWSWANIRNESDKNIPVPNILVQNLTR